MKISWKIRERFSRLKYLMAALFTKYCSKALKDFRVSDIRDFSYFYKREIFN